MEYRTLKSNQEEKKKNTGVVLYSFPVIRIFQQSLSLICYDSSKWGCDCLILSQSTFLIIPGFLSQWNGFNIIIKADNFELCNSLKRNFTNMGDLPSSFVCCESYPRYSGFMWDKFGRLNKFQ